MEVMQKMKIILFGKNGQLGWELQRALAPLGELIALDRHDELCGDLLNLTGLKETIRSIAPDVVVNAAAYTAVDKAESESEMAMKINAEAPALIAKEVAALGGWFIHYSTDYVFDGSGVKPWCETDLTNPLNTYGKSKLLGEQAIIATACKHLIFRTSWVYSALGHNFIKTMLHLARERHEFNVVADQIGAPMGADLLADMTAHALRIAIHDPKLAGIYHVAPAGDVSWYDYANFVFARARKLGEILKINHILPISSSDYVTPAKRPLNSRLNTNKLTSAFSLCLPHWEVGVVRMLKEMLGKSS